MAERGRQDPEEPFDAPDGGDDAASDGPDRDDRADRDGRDPVALAAWRRVAAQRGLRRPGEGGGSGGSTAPGTPAADDEPTVEVPSPAAAPATERPATGTGWTASRPPPGFTPDPRAARPPLPDGPYGAPAEHGGRPPVGSLHDVLLGLAGRIDDDALAVVRELVAVEDDAGAAELLSGCLLADAVALGTDDRTVLAPWFAATRVDADLLDLLPTDEAARERRRHRFVSPDAVPPGGGVAPAEADGVEAVARAAGRLPGVVSVSESRRVTPAGTSSGPLPHRVLVVAVDTGSDAEHVAHRVAYAARGLGAVSVEVVGPGTALPVYHRDALAVAAPVLGEVPDERTIGAGEGPGHHAPVSVAEMLLADLPEAPAVVADAAPDRGDHESPGEVASPADADLPGPAVDPGSAAGPAPYPAQELDPDEVAARIARLWSTPAPGDPGPPPVGSGEPEDRGAEPGGEVEPPSGEVAPSGDPGPGEDAPAPLGDGIVPRVRSRRWAVARGAEPAPDDPAGTPEDDDPGARPRTNGHHHGVNGVDHGADGTARATGDPDPPTDPFGWPAAIVAEPAALGDADPAEDAPYRVNGVNGHAVDAGDPAPTGPTGPTPLAGSTTGRLSPVADSLPELSDRERELLARLHEELAAREREAADPFGPFGVVAESATPTTPLPTPGEPDDGGGGPGGGGSGEGPRPTGERDD